MKCLLKLTKFKTLEHCKDDFGLKRHPIFKVINCLEEHKVKHCVDCKDYPLNKKEVLK